MEIKANMAANVLQLLVNVGDKIEVEQEIAILESMKMEIPLEAETGGTVSEIKISEGGFVNEGDVLIVLE